MGQGLQLLVSVAGGRQKGVSGAPACLQMLDLLTCTSGDQHFQGFVVKLQYGGSLVLLLLWDQRLLSSTVPDTSQAPDGPLILSKSSSKESFPFLSLLSLF